MSAPFMQLYVADYLGDTQHLTTEQHGAYLLLLMAMWRQGGQLPSDPKMLARIARVSARRWHLVAPEVMAFFDEEGGAVTQKRLVEEYQKALSKSEKRSASGKAGGNAKSLKSKGPDVANATDLLQHLSEPEPYTSLSNESSEARGAPSRPKEVEKAKFPDFIRPEVERGFRSFRSKSKKPLTDRAVTLLSASLQEIKERGGDPNEALDMCCERGWQAVKPEYYFNALERLGRKPAKAPVQRKLPETDEQWARTVHLCRLRHHWPAYLGPAPDMEGCKAPAHLITPKDRREYWRIMQEAS